jgi:hypothetical protein
VTRDAFEFVDKNRIELVRYFAKSSLGGAYSDTKVENIDISSTESNFQKSIVVSDLNKEFPDFLANNEFDHVIYDAIDERFNLLIMQDGSLCAFSNELQQTKSYKQFVKREILLASDEFFTCWEKGWNGFIEQLDAFDKRSSLLINKVFWAKRTMSGDNFLPSYTDNGIDKANAFLAKLYERMAQDIPKNQFIEFDDSLLIGSDNHKWGKSPFHYIDGYYKYFAEAINKLQNAQYVVKNELLGREISALYLIEVQHKEFIDNFGFTIKDINTRSNGNIKVFHDYILASYKKSAITTYELNISLKQNLKNMNGITVCCKLSGWEEIKYLAIGYTASDGFRHVKIVHLRQSKWCILNFCLNDLIVGIQHKWQNDFASEEGIGNIRLYVKGIPNEQDASVACKWFSIWQELPLTNIPPYIYEYAIKDEVMSQRKLNVLNSICLYQKKCDPEVLQHAKQFMQYCNFPSMKAKMLDWSFDATMPTGLIDVGTHRYLWHSMQLVAILITYGRDENDIGAFFAARDYVSMWLEKSFFNHDEDVKFTWYDHGAAERLLVFLMMHEIGCKYGFDMRFMIRLRYAILKHGLLLESEAFYASHQLMRYHNHAWFQDMTLIAAAQIMDNFPCAQRWLNIGIERLTDQINHLIVRDNGYAVFVENSIGYHDGVQRILEFAGELVYFSGQTTFFKKVANELIAWSAFLRYPNNKAPSQGDTFRISRQINNPDIIKGKPYQQVQSIVLPKAGYAIVKGNHDELPFMFCMFASSLSKTHKHEDNLSFTFFFDGIEWFVDPSFYSHEYTKDIPLYLRSALAHNSIAIPNKHYSIEPHLVFLSDESTNDKLVVKGKHYAYTDITISRYIEVALNTVDIRCKDSIVGDLEEEAYLVFHLGECIKAKLIEDNIVELKHDSSQYMIKIIVENLTSQIIIAEGNNHQKFKSFIGQTFMKMEHSISVIIPIKQTISWHIVTLKYIHKTIKKESLQDMFVFGQECLLANISKDRLKDTYLLIKSGNYSFHCLYFEGKADNLFVLLSGAIDRNKRNPPYFTRWKWRDQFLGNVLCISDPTLLINETIEIGWYIGSEEHNATSDMAELVKYIAKILNIPNERIISYGSSGGGFGALMLASKIEGSLAVAINPQTNIFLFSQAQGMLDTCFPNRNKEFIEEKYGDRVCAQKALKNSNSRVLIAQNTLDEHHWKVHYPLFAKEMGLPMTSGISKDGKHRSLIYDDLKGHGHESQEVFVEIMHNVEEMLNGNTINKRIEYSGKISNTVVKNEYTTELSYSTIIDTVNIFHKNLSKMKIIDFGQKDKGLSELSCVFNDDVAKNILNEFDRLQNDNVVKEFVDCIDKYGQIRLNPFGDNEFSYCNKNFSTKAGNFLYFQSSRMPFFAIQIHPIIDAYYFPMIGVYYGIVSDAVNSLKKFIDMLLLSNAALDYLFSPVKSTFLGWMAYQHLPFHYFYDVMPMVHVALTDKEACKYPIVSICNEAYLKLDDFYDCKFQILQRESPLLYSKEGFFVRLLRNNFSKKQNEHNNVYDHIASFVTHGRLKYEHNCNITKPVIWIGIIAGKRTWVEQVIGYALIIRKILKLYKSAFFIFDGMTTGEGVHKENYKKHQVIIEEVLSKVSQSINYINLNGAYASEKLYFANMVDFFITDGATASIYVAKFFKKYGVAFLSDHTGLTRHSHYNTTFYSQDCVRQIGSNERWDKADFSIEPKKFAKFILDKLTSVLESQTHDL